jgi:hypothetical protein
MENALNLFNNSLRELFLKHEGSKAQSHEDFL